MTSEEKALVDEFKTHVDELQAWLPKLQAAMENPKADPLAFTTALMEADCRALQFSNFVTVRNDYLIKTLTGGDLNILLAENSIRDPESTFDNSDEIEAIRRYNPAEADRLAELAESLAR